jgi:hypothetical protein
MIPLRALAAVRKRTGMWSLRLFLYAVQVRVDNKEVVMRVSLRNVALVFVGLGVLLLATGIPSMPGYVTVLRAERARGCSDRTLKGTYAYNFQPAKPAGAVVGRVTFDGRGTVTDSFMANFGGGAFPVETAGIYGVDVDCTFTGTLGGASHQFGVVSADGRTLRVMNTDPGFILAFMAEKQTEDN